MKKTIHLLAKVLPLLIIIGLAFSPLNRPQDVWGQSGTVMDLAYLQASGVSDCVYNPTPTPKPTGAPEPPVTHNDPCETNNDAGHATVIAPGVEVKNLALRAAYVPALFTDVDVFTANLTQGRYRVWITPTGRNKEAFDANMRIRIYTSPQTIYDVINGVGADEKDPDYTFDILSGPVRVDFEVYGNNPEIDYYLLSEGGYTLNLSKANPIPQSSPTQIPYEPNNTLDTAWTFVPNQKFSNLVLTQGDHDFFAATLNPGKYEIKVSVSNAAVNPDMRVYVNRALVADIKDNGGNPIPSYILNLPQAAHVAVEFYGAMNVDYSGLGTYSFSVDYVPQGPTATPTSIPYEPNDRMEDAISFVPNQKISGLTLRPNDRDFFTTILNKGRYDLKVSVSNAAINPDLRVYLNGQPYKTYLDNGGDPVPSDSFYVNSGTTLTLEFWGANPAADYGQFGTYAFELTYVPAGPETPTATPVGAPRPDAYEPNNDADHAVNFVPDQPFEELTLTKGDHDFFYTTVNKGMYQLKASVSATAINPDVKIYANGKLIKTVADEGGAPLPDVILEFKETTKLVLDFYGANPNAEYSPLGTYSFVLNYLPKGPLTPTPIPPSVDRFEPNNSLAAARTIVPDAPLDQLRLPAGDYDNFVAVLGKGKYVAAISTSSVSVNPDMRVYFDGKLVYTLTDNGGQINPSLVFTLDKDKDTKVNFEIFGARPNVDYAQYGEYTFSLTYIPQFAGTEDMLEPNNSEDTAIPSHYEATFDYLTIYSESKFPDEDWFRFDLTKSLDFYCTATSSNGLLDLGFQFYLKGKDNMQPYNIDYWNAHNGNNPLVNFHSIKAGETIFLKVYLENPNVANLVGSMNYRLECKSGLWTPPEPPKPTSDPQQQTPAPGGTGVPGGTLIPTMLPTPTALPSSIPFNVTLLHSSQATPQATIPTPKMYTFQVFSDFDRDGKKGISEGIANVVIFVYDGKSQRPHILTTNQYGEISWMLNGEPEQVRYIIPILNINATLSKKTEIPIKIPAFEYGQYIP